MAYGKKLTPEQDARLKFLLREHSELTDCEIADLVKTSPTTVGNERRGERCRATRARADAFARAKAALGATPITEPPNDHLDAVAALRHELELDALRRLRAQMDDGTLSPAEVLEALDFDP